MASLQILSGGVNGAWVLDAFLQHDETKRGEGDQPELVFLNIDPLLLSSEETEPTQLSRINAWLDQFTVLATAQWIQFL